MERCAKIAVLALSVGASVKCGRRICFHGAFGTKEAAKRKEKRVHGFIREITVRGDKRYVVMTRKGRR